LATMGQMEADNFFLSLIDGIDRSLSLIAQIDHNQLVESSVAISLVTDYIGGETNKKQRN